MKTFNREFEVFFEDVSPLGRIHLEKIAEWMSMAREWYFKTTCPGYLKFIDRPVKMFTIDISILTMGYAKWADRISATLATSNIKKISFEMHIDFKNQTNNEIIARTIQKVAFVNTDTKKFSSIPEDMKDAIVNYIKER